MATKSDQMKQVYRILNSSLPQLHPNEEVIIDTAASRLTLLPTQGRFVVTTERMFYFPHRWATIPRWLGFGSVEVSLDSIERLCGLPLYRRFWAGFPGAPGMRVHLRDGETFSFQMMFAGQLRKQIENLSSGGAPAATPAHR